MTKIASFSIPYRDTKSFSKTLLSYIDRDEQLKGFIRDWPDVASFQDQMELKADFAHREVLVETLQDQYKRVFQHDQQVHALVWENINSLSQSNTFTVTTGHQLNLFTGPLYFLFKIASTIRLARDLKKRYPHHHFVPVYWMATEDHDFEEINHTFVHQTRIGWDKQVRSATGRVSTHDIRDVVRRYQQMLGLAGHAEKLAEFVQNAYLQHEVLADATRSLVNSLFAEEGLVIIDGDDRRLKKAYADIMLKDILEQNSYRQVQKTDKRLTEKGFSTQVYAREINFFYLTDEYRERLLLTEAGDFEVNNQNLRFSKDALIQEMEGFPERFSPNVIMRPVYQEFILPNLAYIGGGAEIVYWLQLKGVFDHYGIAFPLLIPRNSAMLVQNRDANQWKQLGFSIEDFFAAEQDLIKTFLQRETSHQLNLHSEKASLEPIFEELKSRVGAIDYTLISSADAVKKRLSRALDNLEKKLLKAEKRNHRDAVSKINRIKAVLFPAGVLQERKENFAQLYVQLGAELIDTLLEHLDPLDFTFTVLEISPE